MKQYIYISVFLLVGALFIPAVTQATGLPGTVELEGYAWSSTIGWISMDCDQSGYNGGANTCASNGGVDYGIDIANDGTVTGYAWSPYIGWIKFDGLSGYPSGSGTTAQDAEMLGTTPNLSFTGWARACSGAADPVACTGGTNLTAGGWDGWISLEGASYGVAFAGDEADTGSYAWGGPVTVGWIDFAPTVGGIVNPVRFKATADIVINAIADTPGTADALGYYDRVTFLADVVGIPDGETVDYDLSLGPITQSGTVTGNTLSGPTFSPALELLNVPFNNSDALVLEVDMPAPGAVREINETNVYSTPLSLATPPPTTMIITGPEVIRAGETAEVSWEVAAPYPVTCTVLGPGLNETVVVAGALGAPDTQTGSRTSAALTNATRFELTCTVGPDVYTEVYQVEVIPTFQEI